MNRACCATVKTAYKKVTHVIFDLDGLLLDTENIYTHMTNNIIQPYGKTLDWSIKRQLMGLTGRESAQAIVSLLDLPLRWEEYYALAQQQHDLLMSQTSLMPDTEYIYKRVLCDIAEKYGKVFTSEIQMKLLGRPDVDGSHIAVAEMQLPITSDEFLYDFRKRADSLLPACHLMPGAERLVRHLHKNKIPIAIATSSTEDSTKIKTAKYEDVFSLFNHIVTGGSDPEVKHGKPSPDIFLICASRFPDHPQPEQCLVLEDAPNGVTAATSAGMQVIMVPDPNINAELTRNATQVLKTLEAVKPEYYGLPAITSS